LSDDRYKERDIPVQYSIKQSNKIETISLEGELTISCADELREVLMDALLDNDQISLNLEQVAEIDLPCLQLLCSAHRSSMKAGKSLTLTDTCPESLKNVAERAGFLRHIGCTTDIHNGCLWAGIQEEILKISMVNQGNAEGNDLNSGV
jgi:anti-anti-sigma factor